MEGGMGWPGYPSNDSNEDLDAVLRLFTCGGPFPRPLPPTNPPFASLLPLQLQPQVQQLPADAGGYWQQLSPYLSLPTDPATVVAGGPVQGIAAAPLLQPGDLYEPASLQDPDPYQSWFTNTPRWWSPEPDLAPVQPLSQIIIQAPVPSVQPPANNPPLPGNTTGPASSRRGGARSSRSNRRRRRPDVYRTVRQVVDGTLLPDYWAWRKYGQKVLKSSGNMRSYYKCTTDKSCKARKYVENCSINPVFNKIIYIDTHCHPMPLPPSARVHVPALAPAPAPAATPTAIDSPLPTTPPPLPEIPVVEGPLPAPALPAFAPAKLSPFLSFTEVELDVEDYRESIASGMELKEKYMTSDADDGIKEENDSNFMFPMPYETAASSSSGGGGGGDDGSTSTAPVPVPIENIFDEMFGSWPWDSLCVWQ